MQTGDILTPVYPYKEGQNCCPMCGEKEIDRATFYWKCGFSGAWIIGKDGEEKVQVYSPCSNYKTETEVVSSHSCTCDIMLLMRRGCICGGI